MTQKGEKNQPHNSGRDSEIATINQDKDGDVTLTLRKEKFAEFLFGFLGAKETLSKTFNEDFTIKFNDLLQFHYLLTQKIAKEQFISLSVESATIEYDDETKRTINTFESIEKYSEYRDVGVLSFELSWEFMFKEPTENTIRNQKVSVYFETQGAKSKTGTISVKIEHTNQVWASEVLRLFEEHIRKIVVKYSLVYRVIRFMKRYKVLGGLAIASAAILVLCVIYVGIQISNFAQVPKVKDEFIFDASDVVAYNEVDTNILLQFFLIRDLRDQPKAVIKSLQDTGHFDPRYKELIDKWVSGYYDKDDKSNRLTFSDEALFRDLRSKQNIIWVYPYALVIFMILVGQAIAALYLQLFRMKSVLALTTRGLEYLEKQKKSKVPHRKRWSFRVIYSNRSLCASSVSL